MAGCCAAPSVTEIRLFFPSLSWRFMINDASRFRQAAKTYARRGVLDATIILDISPPPGANICVRG